MNIGVSGLFNRPGKVGGAENMLYTLLEGMVAANRNCDQLFLITDELSAPARAIEGIEINPVGPRKLQNRIWREAQWNLRARLSLDSILYPNYFTPPIDHIGRIVTVIHDLQFLHFPENFSQKKRLWQRGSYAYTLRRADTVVAISEYVKQDLLDHFGARWEPKIRVIPNAIGLPTSSSQFLPDPEMPTILAVSAHYPHKNLETLVDAFSIIHRIRPDVRLVLVGQLPQHLLGTSRIATITERIALQGLDDAITVTGYVSAAERDAWYARASVFAFPSLFEGFGMPPVEALGRGIPVVTTRCASIPEVTMGMAQYVEDPLDEGELAERLIDVIDHRDRFAPSVDDINLLRSRYAPQSIGGKYLELLRD